jgi:hypothetical protein
MCNKANLSPFLEFQGVPPATQATARMLHAALFARFRYQRRAARLLLSPVPARGYISRSAAPRRRKEGSERWRGHPGGPLPRQVPLPRLVAFVFDVRFCKLPSL